MSEDNERPSRTKGRSPAYPAISLEKAIQRVDQLYRRDRQHPMPVSSVAKIWGYANLNGPAALAVSALKKFGLVDDEGSKSERMIRVTDSAVSILHNPDAEERAEAVREAALKPSIHRETWEEFGAHLPSESTLEWRLVRERGFTETGAREFIREWRDTMEFAGLDKIAEWVDEPELELGGELMHSDTTSLGVQPDGSPREIHPLTLDAAFDHFQRARTGEPASASGAKADVLARFTPQPINAAIQTYTIPIALSGRPPIEVRGGFPLTEDEWAQFMVVLNAMKPVLVGAPIVPEADGD